MTASGQRGHRGLRWTGAIVILVIVAILIPVTLVARYARGELLNTDRYVATVAPLASNPDVQAALTDRMTTEIISKIDVPGLIQQATSQLNLKRAPALGALVVGPLTDWLTTFVHQHVQKFVTSPAFVTLWTNINRLAHQGVNTVLTGKTGGVLGTTGDAIVLNIGPLIDAAKTALVADGFNLASKIPPVSAQFTLFETDQLPKVQRYVRLLNALANWLPWITLALLALAIWLAPNRRRAAIAGLLTAIVILIVLLIVNQIGRHAYSNQLASQGRNVNAGLAIYDHIIHFLLLGIRTTLFTALAAVIWVWLAGPGRAGTAVRTGVGRGFQWAADKLAWSRSGFVTGLERYWRWIYLALGIGGFILLLRNPSVLNVTWLLLVAIIITAIVAILHRLRGPHVPAAV